MCSLTSPCSGQTYTNLNMQAASTQFTLKIEMPRFTKKLGTYQSARGQFVEIFTSMKMFLLTVYSAISVDGFGLQCLNITSQEIYHCGPPPSLSGYRDRGETVCGRVAQGDLRNWSDKPRQRLWKVKKVKSIIFA